MKFPYLKGTEYFIVGLSLSLSHSLSLKPDVPGLALECLSLN